MQSKKDFDLHEKKYKSLLSQNPKNLFKPRVKIFNLFEKKINKIKGNILDIGAGTGYASIWLALNSNINSVISVETSDICINEIIPKNSRQFKVENKVKPLKGNFSDLDFNDHFDYVISFGSIHHSDCLFKTMSALGNYLKDGGYLIMNEPTMPDYTTNAQYVQKYNEDEIVEGIKMKNHERNDKFFRFSEYIVAGCYSGLDLIYHCNFKTESTLKKIKRQIKLILFLRFEELIKEFKKKTSVSSQIYFFQKKKTEYIPHKWKDLK